MKASDLEVRLGYEFRNKGLLRQALTHRSYGTPNNERLEFLGDSVLNCVTAAMLYEWLQDRREGELSRLRATLVCQAMLAEVAGAIALGPSLRLGDGELKSGGAERPSILADGVEALIGACFLDGGFDAAAQVVRGLFLPHLEAVVSAGDGKDAKTALQEVLQGKRLALPRYHLLGVRGEAHAQTFQVDCEIPALGIRVSGSGTSRRSAEQAAAQAALTAMTNQTN